MKRIGFPKYTPGRVYLVKFGDRYVTDLRGNIDYRRDAAVMLTNRADAERFGRRLQKRYGSDIPFSIEAAYPSGGMTIDNPLPSNTQGMRSPYYVLTDQYGRANSIMTETESRRFPGMNFSGPYTSMKAAQRAHSRTADSAGTPHIPGKLEPLKNPPRTKIYEEIEAIYARKGPGHKCDAACRRAGHRYVHKFKTRAKVLGNADGSLTIK